MGPYKPGPYDSLSDVCGPAVPAEPGRDEEKGDGERAERAGHQDVQTDGALLAGGSAMSGSVKTLDISTSDNQNLRGGCVIYYKIFFWDLTT